MDDTVDRRFDAGALAENVETEGKGEGPDDDATNLIGQHDAQSKDGQHGTERNHDSRSPLGILERFDDVVVGAFDAFGLSNDDFLNVVNPNL